MERFDNGWRLPVDGLLVTQIRLDHGVTLLLETFLIRIEGTFLVLEGGGSEQKVDPEGRPEQLIPALRLFEKEAVSGSANDDGGLELNFHDGTRVFVPASQQFEPWELAGPEGLIIVSAPGGEISIWRS
ncbi:DUF6188 family protein [Sinomonas mesophila]|uniref:DUF6188 family protein n=1 Tax=Sinomonas mesophila TaxID=1531955 RepID=UPI0011159525|nr:DUF6188 family protein [Sinomonas mesophila]